LGKCRGGRKKIGTGYAGNGAEETYRSQISNGGRKGQVSKTKKLLRMWDASTASEEERLEPPCIVTGSNIDKRESRIRDKRRRLESKAEIIATIS